MQTIPPFSPYWLISEWQLCSPDIILTLLRPEHGAAKQRRILGTFPKLFLSLFPGFSCHGSWREPDRQRGGHVEYLIVKETAPSSERRLCARIAESSSDNLGFGPSAVTGLNVSLVASDRDCPRSNGGGVSADPDTVWDFSLSRASELNTKSD